MTIILFGAGKHKSYLAKLISSICTLADIRAEIFTTNEQVHVSAASHREN